MPEGHATVRLVRRADVFTRESLDEVIVLTPDAPEPVALQGAAVTAWHLLAGPASMHDLAARCVAHLEPGHDPAAAVGAVAHAVRGLRDAGLVVVAG